MDKTTGESRTAFNDKQERTHRRGLRRGDLFIVLIVLLAALALGSVQIYRSRQPVPVVYARILHFDDGRESFHPLFEGQDETLVLQGPVGTTRVYFRDGQAAITYSDCPDDICVIVFGWIGSPGQVSVCLPNRIMVEILAVDAVEPQ